MLVIKELFIKFDMGGKNVYNDHKECIRQKHCNEMKGGMYPVDFTYQLYRIMIGIKNKRRNREPNIHEYIDKDLIDPGKGKTIDKLIEYEDKVAHLIATCSFVETCIEKCIFTIQVFDGRAPELKRKKLLERKKNREKANEELSKIQDKTSRDYVRQHKRCVELRDFHYKEISELIKAMGLIEVQSPGEADSQCAAIASCLTNVDGVIAEDSDILIFGAPKIIKNFNRKSPIINEVKLLDILDSLKHKANLILANQLEFKEIKEFREEYFIDMRILLGTDYNDALTDKFNRPIDFNKMFELFVLNNFDVPNLLRYIERNLIGINIPINFEEKWKKVKSYYLEAKVIDPLSLEISLKYPNFEKMKDILHKRNKFSIKFVEKLYQKLVHMYNLYYKIPSETDSYNSFKSYQVKFHNNKLKIIQDKKIQDKKVQDKKIQDKKVQYKKIPDKKIQDKKISNKNCIIHNNNCIKNKKIIITDKSNKYEILAY